jgi:hypothetical protein
MEEGKKVEMPSSPPQPLIALRFHLVHTFLA